MANAVKPPKASPVLRIIIRAVDFQLSLEF